MSIMGPGHVCRGALGSHIINPLSGPEVHSSLAGRFLTRFEIAFEVRCRARNGGLVGLRRLGRPCERAGRRDGEVSLDDATSSVEKYET